MNKRLIVDVVILMAFLMVIWVLLSLPAIFFYIPTHNNLQSEENTNRSLCNETIYYDGEVCREELFSFAGLCDSNSTRDIRVFHDASSTIPNLITGLQIVGTPGCIQEAIPFICLYYFGGVCDVNGMKQQASSTECSILSNGICQTEWELAKNVGFNLPVCELLPPATSSVKACTDTPHTTTVSSNLMFVDVTSEPLKCPLCRENFLCDDFGPNATYGCVPRCPDWNLFAPAATLAQDVVVGTSAVIGLIVGVIVIVVSIVRRKKVLTFPSILVFYETISMLVLIFFQVVTFMDRFHLYCVFPDLTRSIQTATPFCIMAGMITISVPVQLNIWWVTHMVVLFWTFRYPVLAQTARARRGLQVVHITSLVLGLLYPILPIIATILDDILRQSGNITFGKLGFTFSAFPPNLCTGRNPHIVFYLVIFPSVLLMQLGTTCLVLLIWTIHRRHGIINSVKAKKSLSLSTAELKLLLVFFHYIFLQVISFVYFTQSQMVSRELTQRLLAYFTCEVNGHDPSNPCSRSSFENLLNPTVATIAFSLIMLVPVSSIVFVLDFHEIKVFFMSVRMKSKKNETMIKNRATASSMDILENR